MSIHLERLGSVGGLLAAAACPICFPKLALLGALFGLGAFSAYEAQLIVAAQILVGVALLGHVLAYRRQRSKWRLALAGAAAAAFFVGLYFQEWLAYAGFAGLIAASIPRWRTASRSSVVTCPECGHREKEAMPAEACLFFYECKACRKLLRPMPGDCCVFCSYGSVRCPPMQAAQGSSPA